MQRGKQPTVGALRAPFAGSPVVVFVSFHFVWVIKHASQGRLIIRRGGYFKFLKMNLKWKQIRIQIKFEL